MANPTKAKDPAEAALSAVEEALKLDFGGPDATFNFDEGVPEASAAAEVEPEKQPKPPASSEPAREDAREEQRAPRRRGRGGRPPAANDDRRNIGNLVYALQRRPSSAPFWGALALSAVWAALGGSLFFSTFSDQVATLDAQALLSSPEIILATVGILVPIIFFFVMAMMIWRAQEMRIVARDKTAVEQRLAEQFVPPGRNDGERSPRGHQIPFHQS